MDFAQSVEVCRRIIAEGGDFSAPYRIRGPGTFPLNLDVQGDAAAVTLFTADAAQSSFSTETFVLQRIRGVWEYLGGDRFPEEELPDRRHSTAQFGRHLLVTGCSQSRKRRAHLPGSRWISVIHFRVSTEVATLHANERSIPIPSHGHVSVIWTSHRGPTLRAWSAAGELLTTMKPRPSMNASIDPAGR